MDEDRLNEYDINFNSCMVRLRLKAAVTAGEIEISFQFLYGTIKTAVLVAYRSRYLLFQFLYGTIKTIRDDFGFDVNFNFNSCMVRLRPI